MLTSAIVDDADGCTRFAVTVSPSAIAPRVVARTVGGIVAGAVGAHRFDEVVVAVHDVLVDATQRDPADPVTIRVREHDDRIDVEVLDRDPALVDPDPRAIRVARTLCRDLIDEVTDDGHLVRLTYPRPDR